MLQNLERCIITWVTNSTSSVSDLEMCLGGITFGIQLGSVLGETLEANGVPQQLEELFQGRASHLVVVHLLLGALTCSAVHHPHLHLKTKLGSRKRSRRSISLTGHVRMDSKNNKFHFCNNSGKQFYRAEQGVELYPPTPCSSSFISCSVTLGVLRANLRQDRSSSGRRYSSTSLIGRPRVVPCFEVEGTASSRIEPRRVVSWRDGDRERNVRNGKNASQESLMCLELSRRWNTLIAKHAREDMRKKNPTSPCRFLKQHHPLSVVLKKADMRQQDNYDSRPWVNRKSNWGRRGGRAGPSILCTQSVHCTGLWEWTQSLGYHEQLERTETFSPTSLRPCRDHLQ